MKQILTQRRYLTVFLFRKVLSEFLTDCHLQSVFILSNLNRSLFFICVFYLSVITLTFFWFESSVSRRRKPPKTSRDSACNIGYKET